MAKHWWHFGVLLAVLGCASEEASNEDGGGGTNSAGAGSGGTSGGSGASGASSSGSGGSIQGRGYIRYTIDGTTVDVEPYLVIFGGDILDIISHDLAGDSPFLRVIIGWGLTQSPGTFACADEPLEYDSTTMYYGTFNAAVWLSYVKEGSCDVVLATVTPINPISGEATGTFSGTLYPVDDGPPKTVTDGSFHVRYEPPQ